MKSSTSFRFSSVFFFFFFILFIVAAIAEEDSIATYLQADSCTYTLGVKTGNVENAGTDSRISMSIGVNGRSQVTIPNLRSLGVMAPGHDYFEKGNLDFFIGGGPCLPSRVCRITVTSDGTGNKPGWYLEYVEITTSTGPNTPLIRTMFDVNQWLASPPYQLSISRNKCRSVSEGGGEGLDITKVDTDFGSHLGIDLLASFSQ